MSANINLRDLGQYVKHQANLEVRCSCGRKGVLDAAKLNRFYLLKRWNTELEIVGLHLRCHKCRGRPISLKPTPKQPDRPEWMATEESWTRLQRRLRG